MIGDAFSKPSQFKAIWKSLVQMELTNKKI